MPVRARLCLSQFYEQFLILPPQVILVLYVCTLSLLYLCVDLHASDHKCPRSSVVLQTLFRTDPIEKYFD